MTTNIKTLIRRLAHSPELELELVSEQTPQWFLPIAPTSRLWLPKLGIGDDERFASIFRDVWRRLPLRDRRRMVKHWREDSLQMDIGYHWSPWIELVDKLPLKAFGNTDDDGHSIDFLASAVDAMPAIHVGELIAHELAHVALNAVGEFQRTDTTKPRVLDDAEIMADEIMELWDFDPYGIDEWARENWTWPGEAKKRKNKTRGSALPKN